MSKYVEESQPPDILFDTGLCLDRSDIESHEDMQNACAYIVENEPRMPAVAPEVARIPQSDSEALYSPAGGRG